MNQDIQMLASIKATTAQNKENLDNLKKELGLFSQHLKRIDQPRIKSPETNAPGYDQEVLNSVREKLKLVQEEQEKTAQKNKKDVARLLENLDEKQVCGSACVCGMVCDLDFCMCVCPSVYVFLYVVWSDVMR